MSVINQMLKDLEQRRAQGFDNNADMLDDLGVSTNNDNDATKGSRKSLWLLLILTLCVVAAFSFILWKTTKKQVPVSVTTERSSVVIPLEEPKSKPIIENTTPVVSSVVPEAIVPILEERVLEQKGELSSGGNESVTEAEDLKLKEGAVEPKVILSSGLDESVTETVDLKLKERAVEPKVILASDLDKSVTMATKVVQPILSNSEKIHVESVSPTPLIANGKREIITVRGSGFNAPLKVILEWDERRAFKELEPWQVKVINDKEIQLHVNFGTIADDWRMIISQVDGNSRAEYEFTVNAQPKALVDVVSNTTPVLPPAPVSVFNKKVTSLTIDEQVRLIYVEASNSLQQGDIDNAKELLLKVLTFDSSHIQARETLATLLIKQRQYDQAISILEQGRIERPEHVSFVLLLARIHTERGQDPRAIELLERINPNVASNSDYYALLAALYQRSAQYKKAALVYEKLLSVYPGKAVWWMGLGLSLQTTERKDDALSAYQRALTSQGLTADLKRFIQTRISILQQQ